MCFVSRPKKLVTFPQKNGDLPKLVVDFFGKETHSQKHGNRQGLRRTKLQQQGQTLEIFEDFACEDTKLGKFQRFLVFLHVSSFLFIFIFYSFLFFFFQIISSLFHFFIFHVFFFALIFSCFIFSCFQLFLFFSPSFFFYSLFLKKFSFLFPFFLSPFSSRPSRRQNPKKRPRSSCSK